MVTLGLSVTGMQVAKAGIPLVALFSPTSGTPGTSVTVTGSGFNDASVANGVSFNGTAAASFTVDSEIQITAIVPAGSTTGPITVTNSEGSSLSLVDFTVTSPPERHNRSVTLRLTSHIASGRVRANDGFDRCESHARVRIERRRHGDWSPVGRDKASHGGRYRSRLRRHHGRFRAVVERQVMGTHNVCGRAVSWVRTST